MRTMNRCCLSLLVFLCGLLASGIGIPLKSISDELVLRLSGVAGLNADVEHQLQGTVLVEAVDGGLLFQSDDGKIWFVQPDQIVSHIKQAEPVKPVLRKEMIRRLEAELPDNFRFFERNHYVIGYQTELAYAKWIGSLYEGRLYRGFERFWKQKKLELTTPEFPLVVLIFQNQQTYEQFLLQEFGQVPTMVAYYNLQSNRVAMYDLTTRQPVGGNNMANNRTLEMILWSPAIWPMIATLIHEGSHQLIFNRGIQQRFADSPYWLNEGLAMYFETPDRTHRSGWRQAGQLNYARLAEFRQRQQNRSLQSLKSLIQSDELFQNPDSDSVVGSYAESWALVHFLLERRADQFTAYLEDLRKKRPLAPITAEQRIQDFETHFGDDWEGLEKQFMEFMNMLK